jgi:hypothetical protein
VERVSRCGKARGLWPGRHILEKAKDAASIDASTGVHTRVTLLVVEKAKRKVIRSGIHAEDEATTIPARRARAVEDVQAKPHVCSHFPYFCSQEKRLENRLLPSGPLSPSFDGLAGQSD